MRVGFVIATVLAAAFLIGCGSAHSRYPSYEAVLAAQSPHEYQPEPLDRAPACAGDCLCPRVRYEGNWVYHCGGRWIYYDRGLWWSYPHLYIHYVHGIPTVYGGPTRNIGPAKTSRGFPGRREVVPGEPVRRSVPGRVSPRPATRNVGPPPKRSGD